MVNTEVIIDGASRCRIARTPGSFVKEDSVDSFLECRASEVQDEPDMQAEHLEIGSALGAEDFIPRFRLDTLHFNDNSIFNKQIKAFGVFVIHLEGHAFVVMASGRLTRGGTKIRRFSGAASPSCPIPRKARIFRNLRVFVASVLTGRRPSQHLGVLAEHLFCDEKYPALKESWLAQRRSELKHNGAKSLLEALNKAEVKVVSNEDSAKIIIRECAYFRKHADHMEYDRNTLLGIPIGSGAMESQCSQNQNRFKRRGQFWSEEGFAAFTKVYVRYMNNELCYCYRKRAA